MTRGEKTQLGWITYAAISGRGRRSGRGLLTVIGGWIAFALACWLLGGAIWLIQRIF